MAPSLRGSLVGSVGCYLESVVQVVERGAHNTKGAGASPA